ncbi:MAG TPA: arylsulfatase [Mucilaginibacter sp.]|nr:arylsulfatase [Mucilaginibacter sp.]
MKKTSISKLTACLALAGLMMTGYAGAQNITQQQQPFQGVVGKTLSDSKESWVMPVKAPKGAPNVIWIMLDDVGFGASSAFGGVIATPNFDTLAGLGLRYTNFHTAGICAPSRAALLTGRNHHYVHMGGFAHLTVSAGFPGWDGRIPSDKGTIAEILRENGYNTFAVGKYGLTPDEDATDAGPFDRWPSGKGFDHFFGFLGSQTDQYKPDLVEDNAHVPTDGRNLNEQITDKAIFYMARQQRVAPDKPFFLYYAPAATHAPHQVSHEWSDLYKGKFDEGWDVFRQRVFQNQKKMGIIPANAILPERNPDIKAWTSLSADEKKLYARFMEVYAGYLTYADHQVGRLIQYLKTSKQLDNTLIFVIIGDNGASKEGTLNGDVDKPMEAKQHTEQENIMYNLERIGEIGTPEGIQTNYPLGWAQAANTPFKYWKQDANAEGATRNPMIIYYPKLIKDPGSVRTQYGHLIDLLPTTLELTGVKAPEYIRGIKQDTLQGASLVYSISNPAAASRHRIQYYYIFGSRAIYKDGWKAEVYHHPNYVDMTGYKDWTKPGPGTNFDSDVWELYDLNTDYTERINLATKYPQKLAGLKALFDEQAKKNNIYPFIDWDDVFHGRIHHINPPADEQPKVQ